MNPRMRVGDPLPKGAKPLLGTARGVGWWWRNCVMLPPNYKTFAAIEANREIVVVDVETGRILKRSGFENQPRTNSQFAAVSGDGKRLAMWQDPNVTVLEIATGRLLCSVQPGQNRSFRPYSESSNRMVSLSHDGKLLAIGGWPTPPKKGVRPEDQEYEASAIVWNVEKDKQVTRVSIPQNVVVVPLLSPDGKRLVTYGSHSIHQPVVPKQPREPNRASRLHA